MERTFDDFWTIKLDFDENWFYQKTVDLLMSKKILPRPDNHQKPAKTTNNTILTKIPKNIKILNFKISVRGSVRTGDGGSQACKFGPNRYVRKPKQIRNNFRLEKLAPIKVSFATVMKNKQMTKQQLKNLISELVP